MNSASTIQAMSSAAATPVPSAVVALFEEKVRQSPGATAVICGGQQLTYAELNAAANTLAARLRDDGHGPGTFVALGFDRSVEMMIALWAVVKSGAAYVPVDPAYPDARLAHMAATARWPVLLTSPDLAGRFEQVPGIGKIVSVSIGPANATAANPPVVATGGDTLYAIFTSGSTGQPKAATVFHSGFANLLDWYAATFALGPDSRVLVLSSLSFDLTQKNLFAPLLAGGTVILQPPGPYDLPAIEKEISRHGVTLINTTPSAFYPMVDAAAARAFAPLASLRAAVLGGEPISIPRLRAWLGHPTTRAFVANTYGPTECTDICAWHRLDRHNLDERDHVPLGRALPGVGLAILGPDLRPVAPGDQGELCITGSGVGGGYLHDPARTAEKFLPNPCPEIAPGAMLYRTGDLARQHADGVFEFRGRIDHQVKVRGFRIELGEIELALADHENVREAVVTATQTGGEDARLTAWLLATGAPVESDHLRGHLLARLPAYMTPDAFVWLDAFPLTPNGKVDRLTLGARAETQGQTQSATPAAVPSGGAVAGEAELLELWTEVLGRPVTDPTTSFFDLGGNSLHLAVIHARLTARLGRDLPITEIFIHPSVRALAAHLAGENRATGRPAILDRARRQQAGFSQLRRPQRS